MMMDTRSQLNLQATRASCFLLCTTDVPAFGSGTTRGEATDDAQLMPSGRPMHGHKHGRNVK